MSALIEKGFVKLKTFTKQKLKQIAFYELTPQGIRAKAILTVKFLEQKKDEYNELKAEIEWLENELALENELFSDNNIGSA